MKYENFKRALDAARQIDEFISKSEDIGINMVDSPLYTAEAELINSIFDESYGEEGLGWVQYYLWDAPGLIAKGENPKDMASQDGEAIDMSSDETFYKFMEDKYGKY